MTTVVYPSARLSANGATALLDTVDHGIRVCDLPTGSVRWDLGTEHDLSHISLSASGNAVAWVAEDGQVAILTNAGRTSATMPVSRPHIRAIAISDRGDRAAALIAGDEQEAGSAGKLIVIPSPSPVIPSEVEGSGSPDHGVHQRRIPLYDRNDGVGDREDGVGARNDGGGGAEDNRQVAIEMPVYDSGSILANDDCSLLAVSSFSRVFEQDDTRAFVRDGDALKPLWTERTRPAAHGALALYGEWLFAATSDGLTGWRRTGEQVTLPGVMRERMIFSPDGSHLLAYRAEEVSEVTSAQTLFRLIDLNSLREVRRATQLIEDLSEAQFALDAHRSLFEVRVTRASKLMVKKLAWNDNAALTR